MNPAIAGVLIIYGPPAVFAAGFWLGVRWWARHLEARDVMERFRADPAAVDATERDLGVQ